MKRLTKNLIYVNNSINDFKGRSIREEAMIWMCL